MKRVALLAAGAALAAIPAVVGLSGNRAFSHEVPVRIPSGAEPVPASDVRSGDDSLSPSAGARPSPQATEGRNRGPGGGASEDASPGDDQGRGEVEPGDDHGRDEAEPGDDHGGNSGRDGGGDDNSGSGGGNDGSSGRR